MQILTADHVLPISSPPIHRGAVVIDGKVLVDVGEAAVLVAKFPSAEIKDYGEAAILPGFVNCHSHLEITAMRGALDEVEDDFRTWLLRLNELRSKMTHADIAAAAVNGATEGIRAGVTCFGDIGRFGRAGVEALRSAGLRGVVFQETEFSPDDRTAQKDFDALIDKFEELRASGNELITVGLSPHSPYTVGPKLLGMIAEYAIDNKVKLSIHAAESSDETALMNGGRSFFSEIYEKFGLEWKSPECSTIEYLARLGVLESKPLLAHCVTASSADIRSIVASGSAIAHCPKSNAKFGHGHAPFEEFLDAGVRVGLGSDSVASNNVCDILEESRFAALGARNRVGRNRFVTAKEVLNAATLGGAKALGLDHVIGTLEAGKRADIAVVSLSNEAQKPVADIHAALVFSSNARDVLATMVNGRILHSAD